MLMRPMWNSRYGTGRPDNHLAEEIRNALPAVLGTRGFAVEIAGIAEADAAALHNVFAAGRSAARAALSIRSNQLARPVSAGRLAVSGKQVRSKVALHAVGEHRDYLGLAG